MRHLVELTKINEANFHRFIVTWTWFSVTLLVDMKNLLVYSLQKPIKMNGGMQSQERDFWATLIGCDERMWKLINKYNANILSAYSNRDANSASGKKKWLSKFAKPTGKIHLVLRADKQKYATSGGKSNILIDDYIKNIKEWENAGGIDSSSESNTNHDSTEEIWI